MAYNWSIQHAHFPTFTPILDLIHVIERLHAASRAVHQDDGQAWDACQKWMELCWHGDVQEVLGLLQAEQQQVGFPNETTTDDAPAQVLQEALTYFGNNASRMDYPRYRQEGLPITSSLIESQVKEINKRVKGSEKFWNDGPEGEAILQVKAALMSDDERLSKHIQARPGSPYSRRRKNKTPPSQQPAPT